MSRDQHHHNEQSRQRPRHDLNVLILLHILGTFHPVEVRPHRPSQIVIERVISEGLDVRFLLRCQRIAVLGHVQRRRPERGSKRGITLVGAPVIPLPGVPGGGGNHGLLFLLPAPLHGVLGGGGCGRDRARFVDQWHALLLLIDVLLILLTRSDRARFVDQRRALLLLIDVLLLTDRGGRRRCVSGGDGELLLGRGFGRALGRLRGVNRGLSRRHGRCFLLRLLGIGGSRRLHLLLRVLWLAVPRKHDLLLVLRGLRLAVQRKHDRLRIRLVRQRRQEILIPRRLRGLLHQLVQLLHGLDEALLVLGGYLLAGFELLLHGPADILVGRRQIFRGDFVLRRRRGGRFRRLRGCHRFCEESVRVAPESERWRMPLGARAGSACTRAAVGICSDDGCICDCWRDLDCADCSAFLSDDCQRY
mmetsp:Transcript_10306/g.25246  ORF Transcript_10306/g.25246 Transcript_10306/m.25246 type:complete len:418 (+) Transcript_10306:431-1684(+)